ncbi:hypothetical protein ASE36_08050 [Rhizobium sp. Root274]|uniref:DUF2177 family protein n=1 Tax=unclassified Rhizobium TaxID=2613769 RepID=UPI00071540E9|nr:MULTISPECIES: DUF2177 family protein [unclassified Rhizobium]KQW32132.1 hypothetical protein ASC71_08060 [Rhizobium sp. Root1240]KRD33671.1 hypothetical protein ASE36_08050 [Rhizobium sp. Root274]
MTYLIAYVSTAIVFFALDYLWLTRVAIGFYRQNIGELLLATPNFAPAGIFYLFYVIGLVYFAVMPALNANGVVTALLHGALLGLLAYGTYDMTNLATLKGWSLSVSLVDMAWGTVLSATAAAAGYLVVSRYAA